MRVWIETHEHHNICETVFSPAAEPADLPIIEAGANRNWRFQAQEFRFEAHACDAFMAPGRRRVKDFVLRPHTHLRVSDMTDR